jgi:DNA topoisomerase-2
MSSMKANSNSQTDASKYKKLTDKEHVLHAPDTYTGSMEPCNNDLYCFDDDNNRIVEKNISYIPGLFKLFDEAIVNCRDHSIRMAKAADSDSDHPVANISVCVEEDGSISFENDGNGIDILKHPEHGLWIPEMIFAHLRTGTNYNKSEKKIVGGKNGFGVKLIFIWSTYGRIETVDHKRGLKFVQEYHNNLNTIDAPKITKCKRKPYTKIVFKPDFARMKISGFSPEMLALFKKRVYDISAVTAKNVKVKYNGIVVPCKTFQTYIDTYIGAKGEVKRIYEEGGPRWEYAVCVSPSGEFKHVSFVNGISTGKGGKHVDYILNQIVRKLKEYIAKKKKVEVKPSTIKEQLMLFLKCDIENPSFDSQTKDYLSTTSANFGSSCSVSDGFIEKVAKLGIMDTACELTSVKDNKTAKKSDGTKSKAVRGIPKLTDANYAGTAKSHLCTIILCEGDSAKAGIISGLSKEDRNIIGVYPMKGKMFNVRGEALKKISENKEFVDIKKIMGLETNKKYASLEEVHASLRYGKILFMTDQDLDGSHIKGLGINMFDTLWDSLIKLNIIGFMNTPILKAKKGNMELLFYNDGEYNAWKAATPGYDKWKIKYYKGLGTSTSKEFKEYFKNQKIVMFNFDDTSKNSIDMVFNKKRADDRKTWLGEYDRNDCLDTNQPLVTFSDFIHREMKHFSKYDCERSIPNLMDGLKISQRKIMFAAFKKNLSTEIKVAQFSGYVSEHSGYHHGEASLNGAIVNMAQNFVGSNNINLLMPNGQFGTRLMGGKDSASERYIFTQLNPVAKALFLQADLAPEVVDYLDDDGLSVEPVFYAPIIPLLLVNGAKGIGTGFSTDILCYNPKQIIEHLKRRLLDPDFDGMSEEFVPYYQGFKGSIAKIEPHKYLVKGCYEKAGANKIRVTELPVGTWTEDYKVFLEKEIDAKNLKDVNDMSTDKTIDMTIVFAKGVLEKLEAKATVSYGVEGDPFTSVNPIEKFLKLTTTKTTSNMYLFDHKEQLRKFDTVNAIIHAYFEQRKHMYGVWVAHVSKQLEADLLLLSNKARFVTENLSGEVDLRGKKKDAIDEMLTAKKYDKINEDFKYLIKMPMDSVCEENVAKLLEEKGNKEKELEFYKQISVEELWLSELKELEKTLSEKKNKNKK